MADFVPGLELARSFYREVVRPLLREHLPAFEYAAALLGPGSEVLGFDSERSMDHHWGPRVMLFASDAHAWVYAADVHELLATRLPPAFRGISTNFGPADEHGVRLLEPADGPPIAHRVEVLALSSYLRERLGFDPRDGVSTRDWLFTPSQRLLEITSGDVFDDPSGVLASVRASLGWYPLDIWLFAIARQWQRISEEEAFVGRCAGAGDEIGSRIAAARIVRDLMRLCFLLERRYAPYGKWLGVAFAQLRCAGALTPHLDRALAATDYSEREAALVAAYESVAALHNALGITPPIGERARPYHTRPYLVLHADRFAAAALDAMDPETRDALAHLPGTIDQIVDNTETLSRPENWRALGDVSSARGIGDEHRRIG